MAELKATNIDVIAPKSVLVSMLKLVPFLIALDGVAEKILVVTKVTMAFSWTVNEVSTEPIVPKEVLNVAVETPVAEVKAVMIDVITASACLESHTEGILFIHSPLNFSPSKRRRI